MRLLSSVGRLGRGRGGRDVVGPPFYIRYKENDPKRLRTRQNIIYIAFRQIIAGRTEQQYNNLVSLRTRIAT